MAEALSNNNAEKVSALIAEKRHQAGIHGEAHQDWIEAEKQLLAESKKKAPKKSA